MGDLSHFDLTAYGLGWDVGSAGEPVGRRWKTGRLSTPINRGPRGRRCGRPDSPTYSQWLTDLFPERPTTLHPRGALVHGRPRSFRQLFPRAVHNAKRGAGAASKASWNSKAAGRARALTAAWLRPGNGAARALRLGLRSAHQSRGGRGSAGCAGRTLGRRRSPSRSSPRRRAPSCGLGRRRSPRPPRGSVA